jgi:phosphohistidine phosphatase
MRRLIVMRHAKSNWTDPGLRDLDRPLNKRGRRSAALIGAWLRERDYKPDRALVSNARRTQETWDGVVAVSGAAATSYLPEIYHAEPETLLRVVQAASDEPSLLLLGHQPEIGEFARRLLREPPADATFEKFPTAAVAVIDFGCDGWADIGWGSGTLTAFVVPRALERG